MKFIFKFGFVKKTQSDNSDTYVPERVCCKYTFK